MSTYLGVSATHRMAEWDAVSSFMTMGEETPLEDNFEQWWRGLWLPFQTKCLGIAQHQYVLRRALHRYTQVEATTWEESFDSLLEKQYLQELCQDVGLDEEEFLLLGFSHHRTACRKVFSSRVRQE